MGVRTARLDDVEAVTSTQIRAWKCIYRDFMPLGPLDQMTGPAAEKMWRRQWEEAIVAPPTPKHRVLVAVEQVMPDDDAFASSESAPDPASLDLLTLDATSLGSLSPGSPPRSALSSESDRVVGLASHGPAEDPDVSPSTTAELLTLLIDPNHIRRGHGSRLLNATVDHLRDDGYSTVVTWVFADNHAMLSFLESAGWAEDRAERVLDMGRPIRMVRLSTDIS